MIFLDTEPILERESEEKEVLNEIGEEIVNESFQVFNNQIDDKFEEKSNSKIMKKKTKKKKKSKGRHCRFNSDLGHSLNLPLLRSGVLDIPDSEEQCK